MVLFCEKTNFGDRFFKIGGKQSVSRRICIEVRTFLGGIGVKIHITQQGDTLWKISERYDISLEDLMEANPQIRDPNTLEAGTKVWIPMGRVSISSSKEKEEMDLKKAGEQEERYAKEQEGLFSQEISSQSGESGENDFFFRMRDDQGEFPNTMLPPMPTVSGCGCGDLPRNPYYGNPIPIPPHPRPPLPIIPGPFLSPGGSPSWPWMWDPVFYPPMNPFPYFPNSYNSFPPVGGPLWSYREPDAESSLGNSSFSWDRSGVWESSSSSES